MAKRGEHQADDALIDALQSELALLRDENAQLRLERQQTVTPASSAARLADLVSSIAQNADPGEVEWATLSEAIMLREVITGVCDELERAVGAVRRQLSDVTPAPELDRRRAVERRRLDDQSPMLERRALDRRNDSADALQWNLVDGDSNGARAVGT
jgi:hypothetical protein